MSSEIPIHAEGAPSAETAPLLGPNASAASNAAQVRSNGTFPSASNSAVDGSTDPDVENGHTTGTNGNNPNGAAPKLKVNMKALLPALAIGVSIPLHNESNLKI